MAAMAETTGTIAPRRKRNGQIVPAHPYEDARFDFHCRNARAMSLSLPE